MTDERFKNRSEALKWLQLRGQISTGKFYQDCDAGAVQVAADKTISKYQVMEYAERLFGVARQQAPLQDQAAKKDRLEIELLEQKVEKQKLENRKEDVHWLQKEEAWAQMAAIIGKLRDSLRHQFHVGTVAIITSSAGDQQRGPEVYETAEGLISRAFNEIVESGRIEGVFEKHGENEI
jgi:hypothetical protein